MLNLIIAPVAKNDLRSIYLYGVDKWGKTRTERYLKHIKNNLWHLAEHPSIGILSKPRFSIPHSTINKKPAQGWFLLFMAHPAGVLVSS
jgi:plasmid stabilization system protein ParE